MGRVTERQGTIISEQVFGDRMPRKRNTGGSMNQALPMDITHRYPSGNRARYITALKMELSVCFGHL